MSDSPAEAGSRSSPSAFEKKALPLHRLAFRFLERAPVIFPRPSSPFHNPKDNWLYVIDEDAIFVYQDGAYIPLTEADDLTNALYRFLSHEQDPVLGTDLKDDGRPIKPLHPDMSFTPKFIEDLRRVIQDGALHPSQRIPSRDGNALITFADSLVMDLNAPEAPLKPASPAIPSFFRLPFPSTAFQAPFDPTTECPNFMQFLDQVLVTEDTAIFDEPTPDPELIQVVQEMFGYALFSDTPSQTAFFLYGTGQNGKSVLLRVLSSLFPPEAVAAVKISDISRSNFALAALMGKKLNIVHEEESREMSIDVLKNLISGEPLTIERKYKPAILFTPKIKFLFGTNEMPTFERMDPALKRRLKVIPFYRQIPDAKRDNDLYSKLLLEQAGIFHFALEGAKRLQKNGFKFSAAQASETIARQVELERFPALQFFHDYYEVTGDMTDAVANDTMYDEYKAWCEKNGTRPLNAMNFGRQIVAIDPRRIEGGDKARVRLEHGVRRYVKRGIRRRADAPMPFSITGGLFNSSSHPTPTL